MTNASIFAIILINLQLFSILPISKTLTIDECRDLHKNLDISSVGVVTNSTGFHTVFVGSMYEIQIRHELRNDIPEIVHSYRKSQVFQRLPTLGGHSTTNEIVRITTNRYESRNIETNDILFEDDYGHEIKLISGFAFSNHQFCRLIDLYPFEIRYAIDCSTLFNLDSTLNVVYLDSTVTSERLPTITYQLSYDEQTTRLIACFSNQMCGNYDVKHQGFQQESILYNPTRPHYSIFHWIGCPPIGDLCGEPRIDSAYSKSNGDLVLTRGRSRYTFDKWSQSQQVTTMPSPVLDANDIPTFDSVYECSGIGLFLFRDTTFYQKLIIANETYTANPIQDVFPQIPINVRTIDAAYCLNSIETIIFNGKVMQTSISHDKLTGTVSRTQLKTENLTTWFQGLPDDIDASVAIDSTNERIFFKNDKVFRNNGEVSSLYKDILNCDNLTSSLNPLEVEPKPARKRSETILIISLVFVTILVAIVLIVIGIRCFGRRKSDSIGFVDDISSRRDDNAQIFAGTNSTVGANEETNTTNT